jgi:hypothetical protein
MKTLAFIFTLFIIVSIIIGGCSSAERSMWEAIKGLRGETGIADLCRRINAYQDYLAKYRNGQFYEEAMAKLDELYFQVAKCTNDIPDYEEYLRCYPSGKYTGEAKSSLEELYYKEITVKNDIPTRERYLKSYPEGKYSKEAKLPLEKLYKEREEIYYKEITAKNDISTREQYLKSYPKGKYSNEVKRVLEKLYQEQKAAVLVLHGEPTIYDGYCDGLPSGSVVWVEPGVEEGTVALLRESAVPPDGLKKLDLDMVPKLIIALTIGKGCCPLCNGTTFYGATQGPVKIGGKLRSNLKGARVINGDLYPACLYEK